MKFILITGNIIDGCGFVGPFRNADSAAQFGERYHSHEYVIGELCPPDGQVVEEKDREREALLEEAVSEAKWEQQYAPSINTVRKVVRPMMRRLRLLHEQWQEESYSDICMNDLLEEIEYMEAIVLHEDKE